MSFDRIAPFYRAMEFIFAGGKLQRCRLEFLDEIPAPAHILLAGEGHGRFLPECVRRFPEAEIVVLDASGRMLEIAGAKAHSRHVTRVHADVLKWDMPCGAFDLIVTNFFLDCFAAEELALLVAKLGNAASPGATWLLADFEVAARGPAKWRTRAIIAALYTFFRISSGLRARKLVAPDGSLEVAGFRRNARRTYEWGLLKSEWWTRDSPDCGPCGQTDAGL